MEWKTLKEILTNEYDSRDLKSNVRYRALEKVGGYVINKLYSLNVSSILQVNKDDFKSSYASYRGKKINSAESSVINEIYNQLELI